MHSCVFREFSNGGSNVEVTCVKCWDEDALVRVGLETEPDFSCEGCGETFTCEDVRAVMESMKNWTKILAWVETYPKGDSK